MYIFLKNRLKDKEYIKKYEKLNIFQEYTSFIIKYNNYWDILSNENIKDINKVNNTLNV